MKKDSFSREVINAKPFLKWAGGKTQLLSEYNKRLPSHIIQNRTIKRYVEPFVGGGAMFFFLNRNYNIKESFLFDINKELIITFKVCQNDHRELIDKLSEIEKTYLKEPEENRKKFYYKVRDLYNSQMNAFNYRDYNSEWIERASYLIFLNKTCFNGLFRQNKKGEFNVPFGKYERPKICDKNNISQVNKVLRAVEIFNADFTKSRKYVKRGTFVYLDPPYRPLSDTSSFTSYSKEGFNDEDQKKLAIFFEKMDKKGAYLMLSNSDPKNEYPEDEFFDKLYGKYKIERIPARRYINRDAAGRGDINELVIRNYM
ncbi:MAG: Dam family site-specific DNA-(adenine-N6)-methyltransferase [Euryarchaeota archaeon]|nr:Dam family site-specific DNA-(adenine-N6)-methyltransferase [Euryarchaeota archaeon]